MRAFLFFSKMAFKYFRSNRLPTLRFELTTNLFLKVARGPGLTGSDYYTQKIRWQAFTNFVKLKRRLHGYTCWRALITLDSTKVPRPVQKNKKQFFKRAKKRMRAGTINWFFFYLALNLGPISQSCYKSRTLKILKHIEY